MKNFLILCLLLLFTNIYSQDKVPDSWITFFERSGYKATPNYEESINYFRQLEENSGYARLVPFGVTPQGRVLYCFIASKDRAFTPVPASESGKPIIMIINGIHGGEIEGKDASMILLREILITKEKEDLLNNAILMIIPVFNVDGHERRSKYNRINQNGPEEMGWRTTAQNLNLNRDWLKCDAPEMQSLVKLFAEWLPDFIIDSHTTDGADYQYVITYGTEKFANIYPPTGSWIRKKFIPYLEKDLTEKGFLPAPYTGFKDDDLNKGITDWVSPARLSTGYFADQNRPSLLIETHMLKPYKERVFGTKAGFETVIKFVSGNADELKDLNRRGDAEGIQAFINKETFFPLNFTGAETNVPFRYKGIKSIKDSSRISGKEKITFTGEPFEMKIPYYNEVVVTDSLIVPSAYIIPAEWKNIVSRMQMHGIKCNEIKKDTLLSVRRYKLKDVKFAITSYEEHQTVDYKFDTYRENAAVPAGAFIISTNQRTLKLIVHLLEPASDDSFLKWGFFNSILERKEYFEDYVMEKTAEVMIKENPALLEEFEKKLKEDEAFRNDPGARLNFFYERSPYFDKQWNLYPVMAVD